MQNNENQKVLLRITNLKQYFPLKKKDLYVRANDDITLDIYEGETLGLVGESGCGKSTLGRTLLQLYRQTDGRTMYYGKTLDDIAPEYMLDTIRTLSKRRTQLRALEARRDAIQKEYDALADGRAKYNMANALQSAKKQARDAFLDIVNLVGGFMMLDDLTPVTAVFMNLYKLSKLMCKAEEKRDDRKLTYDDAKFAYEDAVSEGRNARSLKAKADKARALLDAEEDRIAQLHTQLESARAQIEEMRKPYKDNEEFQRLEGFRDDGIDLARLKYNEIRKLRSDLQMIFQDPYSSLNPRMTVGQIIGEGMLAHKFFKRKDYDLYCEVPISLTQAALGAEIDVPTLDKPVKQTVPEGTQPETVLRIKGQGVPRLNGTGKGDLYVTLKVDVPRKLTEKQKELLRQFDASLTGKEYEGKKSFFDRMKDAF